jgi:hypothetical protein
LLPISIRLMPSSAAASTATTAIASERNKHGEGNEQLSVHAVSEHDWVRSKLHISEIRQRFLKISNEFWKSATNFENQQRILETLNCVFPKFGKMENSDSWESAWGFSRIATQQTTFEARAIFMGAKFCWFPRIANFAQYRFSRIGIGFSRIRIFQIPRNRSLLLYCRKQLQYHTVPYQVPGTLTSSYVLQKTTLGPTLVDFVTLLCSVRSLYSVQHYSLTCTKSYLQTETC